MGLDMKDILSFSVPGSDSIHELQLGLTLIRFADFDLAFFREQCVGIYTKGSSDNFMTKAAHVKEYLRNCHPYCKALLNQQFDKVVLDCVIEEICVQEGVGLEELWVRSMTAHDPMGRELFKRITEYKTGKAINQWINLRRMQAYAISKMTFIYGGGETDASVHKARKLYYDLAFSLTASELGYLGSDLPKAELCSVPFLPQSETVMKTAVNSMLPVVKALTREAGARTPLRGDECVRDQMAGMVFNVMSGLRRPDDGEIGFMVRKYGALPGTVYVPAGFKAIIDIELDQMLEKGFYIQIDGISHTRMKYSSRKELAPEKPEAPPLKTAPQEAAPSEPALQEAVEKPLPEEKAAPKNPADSQKPAEASAAGEHEKPAGPKDIVPDMEMRNTGKVRMIIAAAEDPKRLPSKNRTLQEVNTRCNLIWTSMNVQTGWSITAEDASEWFRYLTRLRYGIGTGELKPEALDKFLDATLEVYKLLPDNA